ncbi:MAG: Phage Mu protein F like protein [Candidatus Aerophobetes bacterium ADurb.Bin490]|nr:MAG: Phage Mu protein F like protein [Candidatus Aerophobetes bacterium ADurb.Bin490]
MSGIERKAAEEISRIIKNYTDAGIINPDKTLEEFIRVSNDLPLAEDLKVDNKPATPVPDKTVQDKDEPDKAEENTEEENEIEEEEKEKEADKDTETDVFADKPRALNKYEEKANFEQIEKDFDNQSDNFKIILKSELSKILDKYIFELRKRTITDNGDIYNVLLNLEPEGVKELENILTGLIKKSVLKGQEQVNTELKAKTDKFADTEKLAAGAYAWVKNNAKRIAENKIADIKKRVAGAATTEASFYPLNKPLDTQQKNVVIAAARAAGLDYLDNDNNFDASSIIPLAVNMGRKIAAENNSEVIGFLYSAVMDDRTTDICRKLDGQTRAIDDLTSAKFDPPNHFNCRSILIPISAAEGIPEGGFTGFNYSA